MRDDVRRGTRTSETVAYPTCTLSTSDACCARSPGAPCPVNVGLILDGNRRYTRDYGLPDPLDAYEQGAEKLDALLE